MTEEIAGAVAPAADLANTAPEAVVLSQEPAVQAQERDYDAEAKEMGWVPEAEFRGPKERWKPAQQFVEDGENILPIVRAENKRLKDKLDAQEKDYATRFERLDKASRIALDAAKSQFEDKLSELTARRDAAVAAGDLATFKAVDKQITDHAAREPKADDVAEAPQEDRATVMVCFGVQN